MLPISTIISEMQAAHAFTKINIITRMSQTQKKRDRGIRNMSTMRHKRHEKWHMINHTKFDGASEY